MMEITLPAMGEGIIEAEITRWMVSEGMLVEMDQPLVEVATDKVDNEIPSPARGKVQKILLREGDTARVGQVMALIDVSGADDSPGPEKQLSADRGYRMDQTPGEGPEPKADKVSGMDSEPGTDNASGADPESGTKRGTRPGLFTGTYEKVAFLSPVVRKLAAENGISPAEIQQIQGSGVRGRITRADILAYLSGSNDTGIKGSTKTRTPESRSPFLSPEQIYGSGPGTVEEMDRMRKLIADHMVYSKRVAPHVTSFIETDVTELVRWKDKVQDAFRKKYGQKLTLTTLILEAAARALKDHPGINVSVDGYRIIRKQGIHIGMATALPSGNLIVPVIHDADRLSLGGLAAKVNDLADRARANKLLPSEIQGGTFTVTNLGSFGSLSGTPIIHQPQAAILAVGTIAKKPAVVEVPEGEAVGIRNILVLSLTYDHRVVDGALGGTFLQTIGKYLQNFDLERKI